MVQMIIHSQYFDGKYKQSRIFDLIQYKYVKYFHHIPVYLWMFGERITQENSLGPTEYWINMIIIKVCKIQMLRVIFWTQHSIKRPIILWIYLVCYYFDFIILKHNICNTILVLRIESKFLQLLFKNIFYYSSSSTMVFIFLIVINILPEE